MFVSTDSVFLPIDIVPAEALTPKRFSVTPWIASLMILLDRNIETPFTFTSAFAASWVLEKFA